MRRNRQDDLTDILPDYDREGIRDKFERERDGIMWKHVDGVRIINGDRVSGLNGNSQCAYWGNHTSMWDDIVFNYAILDAGLPYGRATVSSHLDNWLARRFVKIREWGVILHDRKNKSVSALERFQRARFTNFERGESSIEFPEATRNRKADGEIQEIKPSVFKPTLKAQKELPKRKIMGVCTAIYYPRIPEEIYFGKLPERFTRGPAGFALDVISYARWRVFVREGKMGVPVVNFGEPFPLTEYSNARVMNEGAQALRERVSSTLKYLYEEAKSYHVASPLPARTKLASSA